MDKITYRRLAICFGGLAFCAVAYLGVSLWLVTVSIFPTWLAFLLGIMPILSFGANTRAALLLLRKLRESE